MAGKSVIGDKENKIFSTSLSFSKVFFYADGK